MPINARAIIHDGTSIDGYLQKISGQTLGDFGRINMWPLEKTVINRIPEEERGNPRFAHGAQSFSPPHWASQAIMITLPLMLTYFDTMIVHA